METLWQDVRYGARMLLKRPFFTAIAALVLAVGIGADAAIFTVVNSVVLRPLPYPQPEQLAMVWNDNRHQNIREDITSYPNFLDWRSQNQSFQDMAGYSGWNPSLTGVGEPESLRGASVASNLFRVMGAPPILGREFLPEEEQEGRNNVVALSHGLWQRRFGSDPSIVGKTLNLSGRPCIVTGVMPAGFNFPDKAEIWTPLAPNADLKAARSAFWLYVVGRLKPGVTRAQAQAEMGTIADRLEKQYPNDNTGYGINVALLHDSVVGEIRPALMVLLGAVAFVLLIACANVANLLLARAAERRKEIAVRAALGAGRSRIVRQLLTESLLLALIGGGLGLSLAYWGVKLLIALKPANVPRLDQIGVDGRVLGFTLGISILTGIVFGLAPALQTSKLDLNEVLKEGGGRGASRGRGANRLLVVSEIAMALTLLIGAGLMIKSFWRLLQVSPGFNSEKLLTMRLSVPRSKYPEGPQVESFYKQLQERIAAAPGVTSVSATSSILLEKLHNSSNFTIEGLPPESQAERLELPFDAVAPNYFQTMGIPLLKGRFFTEQDGRDKPQVAIVNETMALRYWPNEDPIGKRFKFGGLNSEDPWRTIVGVVSDSKRQGLDASVRIESYFPHSQSSSRRMEVVVRTSGDQISLAKTLRDTVWSLDKDIPVSEIKTMEDVLSDRMAARRFNLLLMSIFAIVALILSAVGLYGVMSYSVTQRTHEIGIRVALGASRTDVMKLIVGQGMAVTSIGLAVGIAASIALTRLMESLLYGVSAADPATFTAVTLLLTAVAFFACWIPARRAMKVDPMVALRYE